MLTDPDKIIEKVKNGDSAIFRKIVEEFRQPAFSLAFRILCNEEEARDVVQDSFIKTWQKIDTYEMNGKFSGWLFRIVANSAIDRVRQIRKVKTVNIDYVINHIDTTKLEDNQAVLENKEYAGLIKWLSEGLPEKQKLVFILRDIQGMGSTEVQQILNMPGTSVKSNLHHARITIRQKLLNIIDR